MIVPHRGEQLERILLDYNSNFGRKGMFDFFIDTYREYVNGVDVENEKRLKREKEKAEKIIYPKDVKTVTYVLGGVYLVSSLMSLIVSTKAKMFGISFFSTILLMIIDILTIFFLSRKTKKGEITAIILTVTFGIIIYGSTALNMFFLRW